VTARPDTTDTKRTDMPDTAPTAPPAAWTKASASTANGNCVELRALPDGGVAVRDSKDPDGPALAFGPAEIRAFFAGVRAGEFDGFAEGGGDA